MAFSIWDFATAGSPLLLPLPEASRLPQSHAQASPLPQGPAATEGDCGSETHDGLPILWRREGRAGYSPPLAFRDHQLVNGAGLRSPARWPPDRRKQERSGTIQLLPHTFLKQLHACLDMKGLPLLQQVLLVPFP